MLALLACSALMAVGLDAPPADPHQAYQEARARAGRSPDEQVKLALWCEAHGLTAERLNHLTLAVLADPRNAAARGLMGLVAYDGRWTRPEVLADKLKADQDHAATLKEYSARRLKAAYNADAQWTLGLWCDEHGLKDQARGAITAVTRLDPTRENAWKRLGYKRHEGRWVTDAQLAAEKAEADAQKAANKKWKPLLEKYRSMLGHPSKRAEAEAALTEVTDPRAVPMIRRVFGSSEATQGRAVRLFGQVESPAASRALASLALFGRSSEVRREATETLRQRDSREYLGLLIGLIRDPIKYEVRKVGGPGSPGAIFVAGKRANVQRIYAPPPPPNFTLLPGDYIDYDPFGFPVVVRSGSPISKWATRSDTFTPDEYTGRVPVTGYRSADLQTALAVPGNSYADMIARQDTANQRVEFESRRQNGVQRSKDRYVHGGSVTTQTTLTETDAVQINIPVGRMMVESQRAAMAAEQQLEDDVRIIEGQNTAIKQSNAQVRSVLSGAIGQDLGDDQEAWNKMWIDRQGYAYRATSTDPVPTVVENVPLEYQPAQFFPTTTTSKVSSSVAASGQATIPMPGLFVPHHSCFGGGTRVRTIDGDRAIESIRAGDIVLVQDTNTGGLAYHPVVTAYHNPPSPTLRVAFEGESIVVTGIHRFWKAGKGWAMARDLKVGDTIRTLGGVARVESIVDDQTQPVFNLEVADGHSFLVGKLGALVHDNSLVEATPEPLDLAPATVAAAPQKN